MNSGDGSNAYRTMPSRSPIDRRREGGTRNFQGTSSEESDLPVREDENNPYKVGRKVKHPVFGIGTIKGCEGDVNDRKLIIQFQNAGMKRLLAKLSNLQLM